MAAHRRVENGAIVASPRPRTPAATATSPYRDLVARISPTFEIKVEGDGGASVTDRPAVAANIGRGDRQSDPST